MEKKSKKTKNADNRNLYLLPFPSLLFRLKTFVDSWEFCYICNIFFIHQDDEKCHELFE